MSTPIPELPEHCPIGVDRDGNGPIDQNSPDYFGEMCWCGAPFWPCPVKEER